MDSDDDGGMVPSQVFVRLLGLVMVATAIAALVGSRDDIKRYVRIKQM